MYYKNIKHFEQLNEIKEDTSECNIMLTIITSLVLVMIIGLTGIA